MAAPALAGGSGYSQSDEGGITIYRGQHGAVVSAKALEITRANQEREAEARQRAKLNRLRDQIAEQSRQIESLGMVLDKTQKPAARKRRAYYGNPAFFGRNGFIGNSHHGGATIQLPRRPKRPRYPRPHT